MKYWWIDVHFCDFIHPTIKMILFIMMDGIFLHAIIIKLLRQVVWHVNIIMTWYKWCMKGAIITKFILTIQRISAWIASRGGLCADWNLPNSATKKKILLRRNSGGKRHLWCHCNKGYWVNNPITVIMFNIMVFNSRSLWGRLVLPGMIVIFTFLCIFLSKITHFAMWIHCNLQKRKFDFLTIFFDQLLFLCE